MREGDLVRDPDGIKVYIVNAHRYRRHIFNPAVFSMYGHFKWDQVRQLDQATLDNLKTSDLYRAEGDPRVFFLEEVDERQGIAQKRWLDMTGDQFLARGWKWEQVFTINTKERDYYREGTAISSTTVVSQPSPTSSVIAIVPGMLVKSPDAPAVYFITQANMKKPIPSLLVFQSYNNRWEDVKTVSRVQLDQMPTVRAIQKTGDPRVFYLENGTKRWVKTQAALTRLGVGWNQIAAVNQTELDAYPDGAPIE